MVELTIPSVPVAEPRKRTKIMQTKTGKAYVHHYTPAVSPVNAFKATARYAAQQNMKRMGPMEGPLRVKIICVLPRTKNQFWKTKPMPRLRHFRKPDEDNLKKSIYDALNGIVWVDDSMICECYFEKWVAAGDEAPHVWLRCEEIKL